MSGVALIDLLLCRCTWIPQGAWCPPYLTPLLLDLQLDVLLLRNAFILVLKWVILQWAYKERAPLGIHSPCHVEPDDAGCLVGAPSIRYTLLSLKKWVTCPVISCWM